VTWGCLATPASPIWKKDVKQQIHITRASENKCSLGPVLGTPRSEFWPCPLSLRSRTKLISEVVSFKPGTVSLSPEDP
jgi:hypothetical protein